MSREELLRSIAAKVFGIDVSAYPKISMGEVKEWDSMNHLLLISEIEKEFRFKFSIQEVIEIKSLDDISALMQKKGIS